MSYADRDNDVCPLCESGHHGGYCHQKYPDEECCQYLGNGVWRCDCPRRNCDCDWCKKEVK